MKFNEMNTRQKRAFLNIKHAANALIGGLENTTYDYPKDSEEYTYAMNNLNNHDALVNELYSMATTEIHDEGYCCWDKRVCEQQLRDINFCGKEWLMQECENRITKEGY